MGKKIAFFIDSDTYGGAEAVVLDIAKSLKNSGFEGVVFGFGNIRLRNLCREFDIEFIHAPNQRAYKSIGTLPWFCRDFAKLLTEEKITLLHSHLFGAVIAGALAAKLARIPHIGTLHDSYTILEKPARTILLNIASLLGTKIVTVSKEMREVLRRCGFFFTNKIITIHNGVSCDEKSIANDEIYRELAIRKNNLIITNVARLIPLKRQELLISAFAELINSDPKSFCNTKLLIVGDGPLKENLTKQVSDLNLSGQVIFCGFRDDVEKILALTSIFVLPSITEGLSRSILEAMSLGIPVIATNVGGNAELVEDANTGFLIPVDDKLALIHKLKELLLNKKLRETFSLEARNKVRQNFSITKMTSDYLRLYESN